MASLVNNAVFTAVSGGTGAFAVSAAVTGYVTPAAATPPAVDGKTYRYRAQSNDLSQWEEGDAVASLTAASFTRVVTSSSAGGTTTVNFTSPPTVALTMMAADVLQFDDAMSLTTARKKQAQSNLLVPPTVTDLTSGSGTYTTPAGCTRIRVRMVAGGGGGAGGGTAVTNGTTGGNTTFGSSLLVANGGNGAGTGSTGGTASLGVGPIGLALTGTPGGGYNAKNADYSTGGYGGNSPFGGAGYGTANAVGSAALPNTGSGGGGGGTTNGAGLNLGASGGASGGYIDAIINSPAATYAYAIGAGGTPGAAGANGWAGGAGASGRILIEEYYGS